MDLCGIPIGLRNNARSELGKKISNGSFPYTYPHSEEFDIVIENDNDSNVDSEKELSLEQNLELVIVKKNSTNQNTIQKSSIFKTIRREIDLFGKMKELEVEILGKSISRASLTVPPTSVDSKRAFSTADAVLQSSQITLQCSRDMDSSYNALHNFYNSCPDKRGQYLILRVLGDFSIGFSPVVVVTNVT
ncbi:hypothetical protein TNCV_1734011 [Trichonephila clavipes]|nr:hypothetical protein TNCV_1734011 [Trichonephila clavipes]